MPRPKKRPLYRPPPPNYSSSNQPSPNPPYFASAPQTPRSPIPWHYNGLLYEAPPTSVFAHPSTSPKPNTSHPRQLDPSFPITNYSSYSEYLALSEQSRQNYLRANRGLLAIFLFTYCLFGGWIFSVGLVVHYLWFRWKGVELSSWPFGSGVREPQRWS